MAGFPFPPKQDAGKGDGKMFPFGKKKSKRSDANKAAIARKIAGGKKK